MLQRRIALVRTLLALLVLLLAPLVSAGPARAAEKLAFVVGIDAYANLGPSAQLKRPVADAQAVAATARSLGFTVTLLAANVTQETFLRRFSSFSDGVRPGDTVLIYFAGHGIALQGTNFLLPADIPAIEAGQEMLARSRALAEADLSAALREKGARVVVMVVDACRDNPFPKTGTRGVGQGRGLARVDPGDGVFSLYAAGAGQQALDRLPGTDPDPNSVFTRIFVRQMRKPGLNLIDLGESVRDEVARLAETVPHKQVPAYYNEVRGARFVSLATPEAGSGTAPEPGPAPAITPAIRPEPRPPLPEPPPVIAARPPDPPPPEAILPPPARIGSFSYPTGLDPYGDNWLALRSAPSGSAGTRLAKLGPETLFSVLGRRGLWINVRLRDGRVGWVHGDYVGCCRRAPVE